MYYVVKMKGKLTETVMTVFINKLIFDDTHIFQENLIYSNRNFLVVEYKL